MLPLIPFGNNFKACCPFHQEKTPSFNINGEKQMFYCFGCKKGGDIFSFIQEIERVDFKESLKMLAERAGVDLRHSAELSQEIKKKKTLLDIHEYATKLYHVLLSRNTTVIEYLKDRGITSETIKKWRIGYAPDGFYQLLQTLKTKGFSENDLVDSGLVVRGDRGTFDRFRGRIMFPITDNSGKIIGFSGRIFPGSREAARESIGKYLNSPETMIYHKSTALFGFSHAKSVIAKSQSVILVEGQFDAILLHQAGYENTVAISGTACTDHHIEQLVRFATEIIIATDSDRAGIQSAHKIAQLGYQFDCDISLVILPSGTDPADIIKSNPDDWKTYLESKKDYVTFFSETSKDEPLRTRMQSLQTHIFPVLVGMRNHVYRDNKLQLIANEFNVSLESLRIEFEKFVHQIKLSSDTNNETSFPTITEQNSLSIQLEELKIIHDQFQTETGQWFVSHPDASELLHSFRPFLGSEHHAERIVRYKSLDSTAWTVRLDTLWIRIQQLQVERDMEQLRKKIAQTEDPIAIQTLQQEFLTLKTHRESLVRSLAE
jgi:DNA primase